MDQWASDFVPGLEGGEGLSGGTPVEVTHYKAREHLWLQQSVQGVL